MDFIGIKRLHIKDPASLKPLKIEGKPSAFPVIPSGASLIFSYERRFFDGEPMEEALVACGSLDDMQVCYEVAHVQTKIAWYTAVLPAPNALSRAVILPEDPRIFITMMGDFMAED